MGIYFGITKTNTADREDYTLDDVETLSKYSYFPIQLGTLTYKGKTFDDDRWNSFAVSTQLRIYEQYLERILLFCLTHEEEAKEIIYDDLGHTGTCYYQDGRQVEEDRFEQVYDTICYDLDCVREMKGICADWKRAGVHFHSFLG